MEERNVFNPKQAGTYLGCSESVLRLWRSQGKGPRYFRAGKLVRYRKADLDVWIEARLSEPESNAVSTGQLAPTPCSSVRKHFQKKFLGAP